MISGRVGANNTAELGTMVVTEQIDALRILAIDPLGFLIAPRLLAIVFTLVIAEILRSEFNIDPMIFGGLIVYTMLNTVLPGLLLDAFAHGGRQFDS